MMKNTKRTAKAAKTAKARKPAPERGLNFTIAENGASIADRNEDGQIVDEHGRVIAPDVDEEEF